jgi:membrane protein implicated in regulation of membrane protease activity
MAPPRYYRIVLWSLVIFVLVVATPGWFIQTRLAQKMHHLKERVAALEDRVAELEGQVEVPDIDPDDDGDGGDDVPGEPDGGSSS